MGTKRTGAACDPSIHQTNYTHLDFDLKVCFLLLLRSIIRSVMIKNLEVLGHCFVLVVTNSWILGPLILDFIFFCCFVFLHFELFILYWSMVD